MADPTTLVITVRYYAAARAAAGTASEQLEPGTVAQVLRSVTLRHGPQLGAVLTVSSLLLDGRRVTDPDQPISAGQQLDVLPPFAGGAR